MIAIFDEFLPGKLHRRNLGCGQVVMRVVHQQLCYEYPKRRGDEACGRHASPTVKHARAAGTAAAAAGGRLPRKIRLMRRKMYACSACNLPSTPALWVKSAPGDFEAAMTNATRGAGLRQQSNSPPAARELMIIALPAEEAAQASHSQLPRRPNPEIQVLLPHCADKLINYGSTCTKLTNEAPISTA
jgi:hypothetical protein